MDRMSMGVVNFGVSQKDVLFFKNKLGAKVFVETGTFHGGTAIEMCKYFDKVYTIEKSEAIYEIAKRNLRNYKNVELLQGDSREHLPRILEQTSSIIFWLDAHWSGGLTYGENDECPLIDELREIFRKTKDSIILIDDARLFLAPPPHPHIFSKWPDLRDIVSFLPEEYSLVVYEDVIYIFPDSVKDDFKVFIQKDVTEKWIALGKKQKEMNVIKKMKLIIKKLKSLIN